MADESQLHRPLSEQEQTRLFALCDDLELPIEGDDLWGTVESELPSTVRPRTRTDAVTLLFRAGDEASLDFFDMRRWKRGPYDWTAARTAKAIDALLDAGLVSRTTYRATARGYAWGLLLLHLYEQGRRDIDWIRALLLVGRALLATRRAELAGQGVSNFAIRHYVLADPDAELLLFCGADKYLDEVSRIRVLPESPGADRYFIRSLGKRRFMGCACSHRCDCGGFTWEKAGFSSLNQAVDWLMVNGDRELDDIRRDGTPDGYEPFRFGGRDGPYKAIHFADVHGNAACGRTNDTGDRWYAARPVDERVVCRRCRQRAGDAPGQFPSLT